MAGRAALIGIDWGTTSFRAYRIDTSGALIETREAPAGILAVRGGDFEGVLRREIGTWLKAEPDLPVIASGMITSRQGWLEVPYCACPAGSAQIAAALMRHPARPGIHFVPGLSLIGGDGVPDVIRGEETQIIGEVGDRAGRHLLVLPGTHSKWALAEEGVINWFATFMTGEVFAVLKEHSILGRLMQGEIDDHAAFERGLVYARTGRGGLLRRLFSARTLGLFDLLPESAVASYLSGLLIGSEIEEALACLDVPLGDVEVRVVGDSKLARRYGGGLAARDLRVQPARDDASARGQFLIARRRTDRMSTLQEFLAPLPLIAILRGVRPEEVTALGDVLIGAGFAAIEVPLNSPEPLASIRVLADAFGEKALIGAGTVRDPADVARIAAAGGRLIVMPHGDAAVIGAARQRGLLCVPGVATPTEAFAAIDAGADALKLFPAEALPPPVVKAWRAVLPEDVWLLPVGGIRPDSMAAYLAAGADGFGLGSALYKPGMTSAQVTATARTFADAYATLGAGP